MGIMVNLNLLLLTFVKSEREFWTLVLGAFVQKFGPILSHLLSLRLNIPVR